MSSKYIITKGLELKVTNPRNCFEVTVSTYVGDADSYEDAVYQVDSAEKVSDIAECMDLMKDFYPNGRGGGTEYSYNKMPEWNGKYSWIARNWPYCEYTDQENNPDGISSIIWYNEDGIPFSCKINRKPINE